MTRSIAIRPPPLPALEPKPIITPGRTVGERVLVEVFGLIPFAALVAAIPLAWSWGLTP
jgi:stearoyl-CoA desaturase (delta-9 desaturase)